MHGVLALSMKDLDMNDIFICRNLTMPVYKILGLRLLYPHPAHELIYIVSSFLQKVDSASV